MTIISFTPIHLRFIPAEDLYISLSLKSMRINWQQVCNCISGPLHVPGTCIDGSCSSSLLTCIYIYIRDDFFGGVESTTIILGNEETMFFFF